jgi:CO/xanthine dehydrogenase Mo-binding subunit
MSDTVHADDEEGPVTSDQLRLIGTPFRRVDGRAKVTGQTRFADDLSFPRMVHMKLVRSTVPHAKIVSIDTSKASAMPGVVGLLTGDSMPDPFGILPVSQDEHALCIDKVRFVGDPVVAVAALTEDQAHEAALAVEVEYQSLETIATVEFACRVPDAGPGGKALEAKLGPNRRLKNEAARIAAFKTVFSGIAQVLDDAPVTRPVRSTRRKWCP